MKAEFCAGLAVREVCNFRISYEMLEGSPDAATQKLFRRNKLRSAPILSSFSAASRGWCIARLGNGKGGLGTSRVAPRNSAPKYDARDDATAQWCLPCTSCAELK
jgi:hypothetical protein